MERVEAQERLGDVSAGAIAAGTMKEDDRKELMRSWQKAAHAGLPVEKATPEKLAAAGIAVIEEPVS